MSGYQPGAIAPQLNTGTFQTPTGSFTVPMGTPVQMVPVPAPLWVLIDVAPEIGDRSLPQPVQHIDHILAPLQVAVATEQRVPLYSMVPYGGGPALVVAKLAGVQLSGTVLVDSMTPCANAVIEYLRPRAAVVLRRSR